LVGDAGVRRAVRPRPAASILALWQDSRDEPHIFMGRRHASLQFMPGSWFFQEGGSNLVIGLMMMKIVWMPLARACLMPRLPA
jgi:hypothetical protein